MVIARWFLVLVFSVVADLASPSLPGALEVLAENEEATHLSGYRRPAGVGEHDDRTAARRAEAAKTARAAAFRQRTARPAGPTPSRPVRKVPPPGIPDAPTAPEDH
ncbi:MAG TPA: hypothetical protein VLG10_07955 [Methylomirabilota bacterium]|nr:hypothetical protein [Methylomirabilota bacterium]